MFNISVERLKKIFIRDFNLCFFASLCLLSLHPQIFSKLNLASDVMLYWVLPIISGLIIGLLFLFLNRNLAKLKYTKRYYSDDKKCLFIVAFLSGFMAIYISFAPIYTYLISAFIIFLAVMNIKDFIGELKNILSPNTYATPSVIGDFFSFFINLVITFTVINLSINSLHIYNNVPQAFAFGDGPAHVIDAFYFTVITMTTVGYGDITPQTIIARVLVSFECLTSYLLLGIMIGIVTRGINFDNKQ